MERHGVKEKWIGKRCPTLGPSQSSSLTVDPAQDNWILRILPDNHYRPIDQQK